jgi:hypothetical protein
MNEDKGFGIFLYVFQFWALQVLSAFVDTFTLPFRLLYGLFFVNDSELTQSR